MMVGDSESGADERKAPGVAWSWGVGDCSTREDMESQDDAVVTGQRLEDEDLGGSIAVSTVSILG